MKHLAYVKKLRRIPLEHLDAHRCFCPSNRGSIYISFMTKKLEVAKAASNNIFTMHSDLPSGGQKGIRK